MQINDNFEKMPENYLFSQVAAKIKAYKAEHPDADVIRMDIGDVTLPLARCVVDAMRKAVEDMGDSDRFYGYGPEQGYDFLRNAISKTDYKDRGIDIQPDEIFISDGAKSDLGNLGDLFGKDVRIAVADPGYPVYVDANIIDGRGGELLPDARWSALTYLECNEVNGFKPQVPDTHVDVIYLCSPANPTGTALNREDLKKWVDYALAHKSLIIYDSAYESYVTEDDIPRSVYEIEGAKKVAIEVRSFSKTAGFTGLRCGYTVVPFELTGKDLAGADVSLRKLWLRRQTTKFNGASYVSQRAAEALYSDEGQAAIRKNVAYYMHNAQLLREALTSLGFRVFGGKNSPYVWASYEGIDDSWAMFDLLLHEANITCTPGIGFGKNGAGYIRFTGFNSERNTYLSGERLRLAQDSFSKLKRF